MRGPYVVLKATNHEATFSRDSFDVYRYTHSRRSTGHELFAECPRKDIAELVRDALNRDWERGFRGKTWNQRLQQALKR
jgi:hypothetical protein